MIRFVNKVSQLGPPLLALALFAASHLCAAETMESLIAGAKKDGTLTAAQAMLAYEAGAYPGSAVGAGCLCIFAMYDCPNIKIDGYIGTVPTDTIGTFCFTNFNQDYCDLISRGSNGQTESRSTGRGRVRDRWWS